VKKMAVHIHTDGACLGNPGPGGYGVILLHGRDRTELAGGFRLTTNNRMELMAAIVGLRALQTRGLAEPADQVILYTDSRYLADAINRGWAECWRANGWKRTSGREPVRNADLWAELLDLYARYRVKVIWVTGHAGDPDAWRERCDKLARQAAQGQNLPPDEGYEGGGHK